jgi:hypothetical protein
MDEGWIYCMSNECMPGLVKVGQTANDPAERAAQLYTTGVPCEFRVEFAKRVKNYIAREKLLHSLLEKHFGRPNSSREFFKCNSDEVYSFFELMDGVYLEDADKPDRYNLRRFARRAE